MTRSQIASLSERARSLAGVAMLARVDRDNAIVRARSEGMGIREIARVADLDPTQVSRIVKR